MIIVSSTGRLPPATFGIVQGRLTLSPPGCLQWFPQDRWPCEFPLASALGYHYLELIAEREHNEKNPIWSRDGIAEINALTADNNLVSHAICNDYIINHPLVGNKSVFEQNLHLIRQAGHLGMKKLVLPFFEASELNEENFSTYVGDLRVLADAALDQGMLICMETILNGENLLRVLDALDHDNIQCVFDTGNRIAFGHDIYADILLLGKRIQHVHIKDKNGENENVLLGTGKVNFLRVFESLARIEYEGPYTFETQRGRFPLLTAKYNKDFVEFFVREVTGHGYP